MKPLNNYVNEAANSRNISQVSVSGINMSSKNTSSHVRNNTYLNPSLEVLECNVNEIDDKSSKNLKSINQKIEPHILSP